MSVVAVFSRFSRLRLSTLAVLFAAVAAVPHTASAATAEDARRLVQGLEREALIMASPSMSMPEKEQRFRAMLQRDFDMPAISRFVLGRHWNAAAQPERRRFVDLFEDLTVKTWTRRFNDYNGERLDIRGVQPAPGGFAVDSLIQRPQGKPIAVTWRLADSGRGLKVVDIVVDGVSMAITHRSEYGSVLRTAGLGGLLNSMQQQVAVAR